MTDLIQKFSLRSDLHQSPMHAQVMADIGWQTIKLSPGSNLFLHPLGPLSIAKLQRSKSLDLVHLNALRKKYRILTLYLEPGLTWPTQKLGLNVEPFAHSLTSLLDLSLSQQELLISFNQTTRHNIAKSLKDSHLTLRSISLGNLTSRDLSNFFALHQAWTKLRHVGGYPADFMRSVLNHHTQAGYLHFASVDGIASALLLTLPYDHVATYYIAFSTPLGYAHLAPTALTWHALNLMKKHGCDIFDFGGIYDPRYPKLYKNWQGFTKFKEGFRPTIVEYPPTYLKLLW